MRLAGPRLNRRANTTTTATTTAAAIRANSRGVSMWVKNRATTKPMPRTANNSRASRLTTVSRPEWAVFLLYRFAMWHISLSLLWHIIVCHRGNGNGSRGSACRIYNFDTTPCGVLKKCPEIEK